MTNNESLLDPLVILRDDFLGDAGAGAGDSWKNSLAAKFSYQKVCALMAYFARGVSPVQSGVNLPVSDDLSLEKIALEILLSHAWVSRGTQRGPLFLALRYVLWRLGIYDPKTRIAFFEGGLHIPVVKTVFDGFIVRLTEALQTEGFCKQQRAWLLASNNTLRSCETALEAIELIRIRTTVSCVRHDCYFTSDGGNAAEIKLAERAVNQLAKAQSELGLVAACFRGERLPDGRSRLHIVIFFVEEIGKPLAFVKDATKQILTEQGVDCKNPFGYRSNGEGALRQGFSDLKFSLRSMVSRDEYVRSISDPVFSFGFHKFDANAFLRRSGKVAYGD